MKIKDVLNNKKDNSVILIIIELQKLFNKLNHEKLKNNVTKDIFENNALDLIKEIEEKK